MGIDSPVSMDSSTALAPDTTRPSTGILPPGRTRSRSPRFTISSGTSSSEPSARTRRVVFGASWSKDLIARLVWPRACSSKTCPRRTKVTMVAAASKYTWTPLWPENAAGMRPGASVANTL